MTGPCVNHSNLFGPAIMHFFIECFQQIEQGGSRMKKIHFLPLFALVLLNCQDNIADIPIEGHFNLSSNIDEEGGAGTGSQDDQADLDSSDTPLKISWVTSSAGDFDKSIQELQVLVENETAGSFKVEPIVICQGFVNTERKMTLSSYYLKDSSSITITIPVEKLPVQNLTGAATLLVMANVENIDNGQAFTIITPPEYYRFEDNKGENLRLITAAELLDSFGGVVFENDKKSSAVIGRLIDDEMLEKNIEANSESFSLINSEDGEKLVTINKISIGVESDAVLLEAPYSEDNLEGETNDK
jgi:hypothetical protein